jgi:hypothetical protein
MATCPICGSNASDLDITGDAESYDCPRHGKFKVSGTAQSWREIASHEQWEGALARAKARVTTDRWPMIITSYF